MIPTEHPICQCPRYEELDDRVSELHARIQGQPTIALYSGEWDNILLWFEYPEDYGAEGRRVMLFKVLSPEQRQLLTQSGYSIADIETGRVAGYDWSQHFDEWNRKLGIKFWGG